MNIHKLTTISTLLGVFILSLSVADVAENRVPNSSPETPSPGGEVLQGLNGLVAVPVMAEGPALPRRLMGVGVDDRGKVFVTETVRQMKEEISLLQSTFLHEPDMALTTVEEKEKWILENFSALLTRQPRSQPRSQTEARSAG